MKKNQALFIVLTICLVFAGSTLMASMAVKNFAKNGKAVHAQTKDGKPFTCAVCHVNAGIEKKKQGMMVGQPNFGKLAAKPLCAGPACHK